MKRALALMLVVASVAAIAITVGAATAAPAKKQDTSLSGAGSTFVFPLVSKWIPALGSAYGIQRLVLADRLRRRHRGDHRPHGRLRRLRRAAVERSARRPARAASQIPWALSATSILYNLPGINCVLRLTGPILAEHLPRQDHELERRRRSRRSTRTCNLPEHEDHAGLPLGQLRHDVQLHRLPVGRRARPGSRSSASASTRSGRPASARAAAPASPGVLTKTEGAIGYVDVAYALKNKIRFASMLNASGKYATPGLRGIQAAAATLPKKITGNGALSIVEPAEGQPARLPDLDLHLRDRADRARRRRPSCGR